MKRWPRAVWSWATEIAGTKQGAALLVAAALVVYAIQSLGWPMAPGRDLEAYLAVYVDFWHTNAVFPWEMLSRTPVAPLVAGGLLDLGSPFVLEAVGALLFAGTILLYARTALLFGRGAAVLVSVALVCFPGYAIVFHELASEIVFATGFAVWTAIVVRATLFPSAWRFAAAGAATALIALTRPANQVFLIAAILPLVLAGTWRARIGRTAAFLGVSLALLGGWATTNLWRYDDLAVARGGQASLPFFRAFIIDHIVEPDNGPASRELAAAVQRDLLTKQPYRAYGIDLATFFSRGSPREHEDLISLSDRLWGWDSDYRILGRAAREAVRKHPSTFARGVLRDFGKELAKPYFAGRKPPPPPAVGAGGRGAVPVADGADDRRRRADAARPDRGRADPVRVPERADLDTRPLDPRGVDVADRASHRLRRSGQARALDGERPEDGRALRDVPRPVVEPMARPADGPLLEALPAALPVAPRRDRRRRLAATAQLERHARPRRRVARDAARDRDDRLGRAGLCSARRAGVRALRRGGARGRPQGTGGRRREHDEQRHE